MIYICSSTMSSVMNSVCCALVCLLCVSLVAWTITVTSGAPEEEGNGEGDNKQRLRGTEISRGVVCAINSSLDIQQVEKNEDEMENELSCQNPFLRFHWHWRKEIKIWTLNIATNTFKQCITSLQEKSGSDPILELSIDTFFMTIA